MRKHSPEVTCPYDGGATRMPRGLGDAPHVHRRGDTEARYRRGQATRSTSTPSCIWTPNYGYEPYVDSYDQKGHLWRTHIFWLAYRDRPVPDAKVAIYPFKREFVVGSCPL